MNLSTLQSFSDELEKLARHEGWAETATKDRKRANEAIEKNMPLPRKNGDIRPVKDVGFFEGQVRNLRATGKRLMRPSTWGMRAKSSLINPALPWYGKALAIGGAGLMASQALPKEDPTGRGQSRLTRGLESAGSIVGGSIGKGLSGGLLTGTLGGTLGLGVGKAIDRMRGYRPPQPAPAPMPVAQG